MVLDLVLLMKKSCTTWEVSNLLNRRINNLPIGVRFLPSTVWKVESTKNTPSTDPNKLLFVFVCSLQVEILWQGTPFLSSHSGGGRWGFECLIAMGGRINVQLWMKESVYTLANQKSTIDWDWFVPTFPVIVSSCREKVKRWQTSGHYCWEGNKHPELIGEVNDINSHKSTRFPGSFGLPQVYISKPYIHQKNLP